MSDRTIFLFGSGKCQKRQPYCLLGSGLVHPKLFRPCACSSYVIEGHFIDANSSTSVIDKFDKWDL